jgi:hypothetical protein
MKSENPKPVRDILKDLDIHVVWAGDPGSATSATSAGRPVGTRGGRAALAEQWASATCRRSVTTAGNIKHSSGLTTVASLGKARRGGQLLSLRHGEHLSGVGVNEWVEVKVGKVHAKACKGIRVAPAQSKTA